MNESTAPESPDSPNAAVDVSVVIVSYNARELLDDCLASVAPNRCEGLTVECIVVDNASGDGSLAYVREHFPEVIAIDAGANLGFAGANNIGIRRSQGRYVLLLNSDAQMCDGALRTLVDAMDQDRRIGQAGPRLLNTDGSLQRSCRGFPTPWNIATEYWYLRRLFPRSRRFNDFYKGWFGHDSVADMDFLMGACLLVRRTAIEDVGLMNESYFMYSEETDWARRFHDSGWRVTFVPDASCVHLGGGSTRKQWERMYRSQVAGNLRYLTIHDSDRAARRAQRIMQSALTVRALTYRVAGLIIRGRRGQALRERGRIFASARRYIAGLDLTAMVSPEDRIPPRLA